MRHPSLILSALLTGMLLTACAERSEAWFLRSNTKSEVESSAASPVKSRREERLEEAVKREKNAPPPAVILPPTTYHIPILVYHHVRPQQGWAKSTWSWKMTVTPQTFERHMQWLVDHGYETITLDEMTAIIRGERAMPEKPVVITFDDNNLSQYDVALPVLEKHGMTAVFYQVIKYLDTGTMINADRTKELIARGQDVQSHTMTHRALPGLNDEELAWELTESKRILEELLDRPVEHIAYPGTAHNQRVRDAAKAAGYETASIMDPRAMTQLDTDWLKIPRIMMTDDTDLAKVLP